MNYKKLKGFRAMAGKTQPEMANELGMTTKSYNHKENNKAPIKVEEALNIALILGMTLDDVNDIFFDSKLTNCISA